MGTGETHVTAGLMYLPTPWRYVWGPWLPCGDWLLLAVLSGAAASSCVFLRSSAICGGRAEAGSSAGPGGAPGTEPGRPRAQLSPQASPHLSIGLFVGVHEHDGRINPDLLLAGQVGMSRPPTCRRPPSSKPKGRALCSEAHTLGRSVLGSLSTFSMAVSVSKPPTTLQQGNGAPENVPGTSTPEREAPLQTGAQTVSRWAGCQHRLTGPNHTHTHVCRGLGAKGEH